MPELQTAPHVGQVNTLNIVCQNDTLVIQDGEQTERCFSSTIPGDLIWGSNENIPTSHQFTGQFRQFAAPFKAHRGQKLTPLPDSTRSSSVN